MSNPYMIVVDDDAEFSEIVSICGEGLGFEVNWAKSGTHFQELFAVRKPDVIVLDLVMPEMEGTELINWLIAEAVATPIILMSGFSKWYVKAADTIGTQGGLNMIGTLEKPFDLSELEALLRPVYETNSKPARKAAG